MIALAPRLCYAGAMKLLAAFVSMLLVSAAAHAEAPSPSDLTADYRELTRVAPRRNCAAATEPNEITVCGRRRDNLRYRLPPGPPTPGTAAARTVGEERFALQQYRIEGGSGSCTTVGPNGLMGCVTKDLREAHERGEPGLVQRALTYLDPDE